MQTRLDRLVTSTLQQGSAVPAFTCYDFTTALAVVDAAEESGLGVVLLVAPETAAASNGLRLVSALRGPADGASVPVAVQLDHATDLSVMADAVAAGADSVLADGSSLPYEDNIALVRQAREVLGAGVVLEAELGGLAGDEDRAFGADEAGVEVAGLTDSALVEDFVARTGAGHAHALTFPRLAPTPPTTRLHPRLLQPVPGQGSSRSDHPAVVI